MAFTKAQQDRVREIFASYLKAREKNLKKLRLGDLKFNVVQLRATGKMLDLTTPDALLRYRLAQHLERGAVTAMGGALQKIARELSGSGSGVAGADIEVTRNGRRHYVQVKSGPDTANKDIAQNIGTLLNSARARDPGAVCVLGVCYARPEQISPIVKAECQLKGVELKIGREFWEFVSGDPTCLDEILQLAGEAGDAVEATFSAAVDEKHKELLAEFSTRYGATLDQSAWKKFSRTTPEQLAEAADEDVLKELTCPSASPAVNVTLQAFFKHESGSFEDCRIEIATVVNDDDDRRAFHREATSILEGICDALDVQVESTSTDARLGRADLPAAKVWKPQ